MIFFNVVLLVSEMIQFDLRIVVTNDWQKKTPTTPPSIEFLPNTYPRYSMTRYVYLHFDHQNEQLV